MKHNLFLTGIFCLSAIFVQAQTSDFTAKKRPNATQPLNILPISGVPYAPPAPSLLETAHYPTLHPQVLAGIKTQNQCSFGQYNTINYANLSAQNKLYDLNTAASQQQAVAEILNQLGLNPKNFDVIQVQNDELGYTHIKLQQTHARTPVYAAQAIVHFKNNKPDSFNGTYYPETTQNLPATPALSTEQTLNIAKRNLEKTHTLQDLSEQTIKIVPELPQLETVVFFSNENSQLTPHFAHHFTIFANLLERFEYFIDANSGKILNQYASSCAIDGPFTTQATDLNNQQRTINTYKVGANYYFLDAAKAMFSLPQSTLPNDPKGAIWTVDATNTYGNGLNISQIANSNNSWNNPKAVSAHYNGEYAYNYFKNTFNRNSIDGQGNNIVSVINVNDPSTGQGMDNAYWNGYAMFYGNGATAFKPLAGSLDVAGHEMTHGIVQSTANLAYQGESGAINESMADVFGAMIDANDWLIGEDVVKPASFPSGALRSLQDPHNGGTSLNTPGYQPRILSEKYTGSQDNGGVHINSGIPNWAYYKFATSVGKTKAQAVYFRALTSYLTRSSTFADLRVAVVQAATDLHGANSTEVAAANQAFGDVGIGSAGGGTGGTTHQNNIPTNPGTEFLLSTDTDPANTNKLYLSTAQGTGFAALSTTNPASKPSATDNGAKAVFIDSSKKMRLINLNTTTPNEQIIQSQPVWNSVAISKDGNKIAATTNPSDTSIYVFNLSAGTAQRFMLYSPTYSQGVNSGTAISADVLDWDYTGEYLIYDCYNEIQGQSGTTRSYWDVNFMRVWNNTANTFNSGQITSLFGALPDGVSIGDPSFSKNSPYILAFDYIDQSSAATTYAIIGVNIETNAAQTIAQNNTVGYPTYNRLDNAVLYTKSNSATNTDIAQKSVDATKITGTGNETTVIQYGKFAVVYSNGARQLPSSSTSASAFTQLKVYPNPVQNVVNIDFSQEIELLSISVTNALGQEIMTEKINAKRTSYSLNTSQLPQGIYTLQIYTKKGLVRQNIVKTTP